MRAVRNLPRKKLYSKPVIHSTPSEGPRGKLDPAVSEFTGAMGTISGPS